MILVVSLVLGACAKAEPTPTPAPTPAPAPTPTPAPTPAPAPTPKPHEQVHIQLHGSSAGSQYMASLTALADLLNKHHPWLRASVMVTGGP